MKALSRVSHHRLLYSQSRSFIPTPSTPSTLIFWTRHVYPGTSPPHEHATAFKADPFYPTIIQERKALATAPVYDPLRAIQAAMTEVDFYKTTDEEMDPKAKLAAETQEMIRHAIHFIDSLQSPGFIAINWGIAIEDRKRCVTLAGWRSVEVCFFCQTFSFHLC
jgi:hypothetical protein